MIADSAGAMPVDVLEPESDPPVRSAETPICAAAPRERVVIEPPARYIALNLREVWRYRDLLWVLVWRDISARYRQSVLGYGWAVFKPALTVLIFTLVFGRMAKISSDGAPYPIFSLAGLLPWLYFTNALLNASTSVVSAGGLLTKVYFPRLVLPLAGVIVGVFEMAIQMALLVLLMAWYRFVPGWQLLLTPAFFLLATLASLAFGLWLTALNVKYRDVGMALPFLLQAWMWLCPVIYPSSIVPEKWQFWYSLNPMVGVIDGFRWCCLGSVAPPPNWCRV